MKLNSKRTILVGFAFLLICMFWSVYDSVIAKVAISSFGLNQFWSGVIMSVDNILALVLLPLFGIWSDKTKTKFGKRTPYIFIGTVIATVFIVVIGAIDFMQQQAIGIAAIGGIKSMTVGEGANTVTQFYYTIGEVTKFFTTKDLAAVDRSTQIWTLVTSSNIGYLAAFIGILLIVLVAMASFRTPAVSLMPDVTPKPLRSKGNAIINLMGTAGGIVALVYMSFVTKDYQSYIPTFILTAALMIVFLVIFLATVKEIKWTKERHEQSLAYGVEDVIEVKEEEAGRGEKMSKEVRISFLLILASLVLWFIGYNAATSKFSVYATDYLDIGFTLPLLVANGAALISYIPIGILGTKIGRRKTILIGIVILTAAFVGGSFVTATTGFLMFAVMAFAGIGWATINVNSYPMIVELSRGSNIGKYTGYYYTASMAAQIFTPMFSGLLMDKWGYGILFPYCAIFCGLAFFTMFFVKHGDAKAIPTSKLEALGGVED